MSRMREFLENRGIVLTEGSYLDNKTINKVVNVLVEQLGEDVIPTEVALEIVDAFQEWGVGKSYKTGTRFQYEGELYVVVQPHISQDDWLPNNTPALYNKIIMVGDYPVWVQPTGEHNAYKVGDIVWFPDENGQLYECIAGDAGGNNNWSPLDYGWTIYIPELSLPLYTTLPGTLVGSGNFFFVNFYYKLLFYRK